MLFLKNNSNVRQIGTFGQSWSGGKREGEGRGGQMGLTVRHWLEKSIGRTRDTCLGPSHWRPTGHSRFLNPRKFLLLLATNTEGYHQIRAAGQKRLSGFKSRSLSWTRNKSLTRMGTFYVVIYSKMIFCQYTIWCHFRTWTINILHSGLWSAK